MVRKEVNYFTLTNAEVHNSKNCLIFCNIMKNKRNCWKVKVLLNRYQCIIWMVTDDDFIYRFESYNHRVQHVKQYHRGIPKSFHLNGYCRVSSTNSNVITTLYGIINSTTRKCCLVAFKWILINGDYTQISWNYFAQHNKQYHKKILLSSFH